MKAIAQREVERALAAAGWTLARTKGGHNVWTKPGERPMPIPRHGTVTAGVVRNVARALGDDAPKGWR